MSRRNQKYPMVKVADVIARELGSYEKEVEGIVRSSAIGVGKEIAEELRQTSPRRTGRYSKSWAVDRHKKNGVVIRNVKHYHLTHLLEYGHDTRNGGRTMAFPHIKPAEKRGVKNFVEAVEKMLKEL